jgi:hypothetical protein
MASLAPTYARRQTCSAGRAQRRRTGPRAGRCMESHGRRR